MTTDEENEPIHPADEALWLLVQTTPRMRELQRQFQELVRQVLAAVRRGESGPVDEMCAVGDEMHRLACARRILWEQSDERDYN